MLGLLTADDENNREISHGQRRYPYAARQDQSRHLRCKPAEEREEAEGRGGRPQPQSLKRKARLSRSASVTHVRIR